MEVEISSCSSSGDIGEMSTLLVATIEETKERLHQLELLFCSRLFPSFQSRSRALSDALSGCRTRESSLLRRIDELRDEKRRDVEEEAARGERVAAELRVALAAKAAEAAERKEMTERLLRQLDDKEMELDAERTKRRHLQELFRDARIKYRKIKSRNRYLIRKLGLPPAVDDDDDRGLSSPSPSAENNTTNNKNGCFRDNAEAITPHSASKIEQRDEMAPQEIASNTRADKLSHNPSMPSRCGSSPTSSSSMNKYPCAKPTKTVVGVKRSNSSWRDTRANQEQRGFDPHDDFLDTPMEIARGNIKKDPAEAQDISVHAPSDMAINSSDEETQDVNVRPVLPKEPISIQRSGEKTFKYVEPVRKKAERENLKGVECEQCRKFYDAVHPDANRNGTGVRCEHHEGVSRHRYRHVPPMTPEGFWNIGFDSDM